MAEYFEAICPTCDNIIEIDSGEAWEGNIISCDNVGCFFEGEIEEIENEDGLTAQIYFKKDDKESE